jgi:putative exosortase-associated protein (TIGR04073 family)
MSPAYGQSYDPAEELPKPTDVQRAFTKLGRGLSNILLGWAEIPLAMDRAVKERKDFGYFIATAPVLGTARAFMRTGAGVFEVVTFPFSDRDVNYEAVLEPEYIF